MKANEQRRKSYQEQLILFPTKPTASMDILARVTHNNFQLQTQGVDENASPISCQKYSREKTDELQKVVGILLCNKLEKEVLSHTLTSNCHLVACENNKSIISEIEMLGVSYQCGFKVPTSVCCSITKNLLQLLIYKKALVCDKPIVSQLQKKMGRIETNGTLAKKLHRSNALL